MRNYRVTHQALIENVSRRNLLKGIVATGGLVIAGRSCTAHGSARRVQDRRGRHARRTVYDPHVYVAISADGTVTIVAHRSEMEPDRAPAYPWWSRTKWKPIGPGQDRPGAWERAEVRQPGYGWIAQHPALHPPMRAAALQHGKC